MRSRPTTTGTKTRTTTDLDVLLALAGSGMAEVEAALHRRGWTTTALVPEGWLLRVQHPRGGRIDVVASITDYEARALARAHSATVDDLRFKTMAVEDVVILKLIANRFRDIADVESILSAKPRFDWAYMAGWFEEFDLGERYRRIEDDALAQGLISNADTRAASVGDGHRPGSEARRSAGPLNPFSRAPTPDVSLTEHKMARWKELRSP